MLSTFEEDVKTPKTALREARAVGKSAPRRRAIPTNQSRDAARHRSATARTLSVVPEANFTERPACRVLLFLILHQRPVAARKWTHDDPFIAAHPARLICTSRLRCDVCALRSKLERELTTTLDWLMEQSPARTGTPHMARCTGRRLRISKRYAAYQYRCWSMVKRWIRLSSSGLAGCPGTKGGTLP